MIKRTLLTSLFAVAAGLAHADGPHKQSAPVEMTSVVHGTPHAGQAIAIDVTVTPRIAVSAIDVSLVGSNGLAVGASDSHRSLSALAAQESRTISLQVTPQVSGVQHLSVIADVGGIVNGATRRTWTISLAVDVPADGAVTSERKPTATDATGQKIQSMHGVTR